MSSGGGSSAKYRAVLGEGSELRRCRLEAVLGACVLVALPMSGGLADADGVLSDEDIGAVISGEVSEETQERIELARVWKSGGLFRDRLQSGGEGPEMVVVPAGSFRMGCVSGDDACDEDELPVRDVSISVPFAVGVYEVSFAEWDACVAAGGCGRTPGDRGWGRGTRPVTNVSWEDAGEYVVWLSSETGEHYRLLSEAEWEYAARAGSETKYSWGDEIGRNRANCDGCGSRWDDEKTAPVGSFGANGFGLHDMHGNLWEWVEDCWNGRYAGAPSDGSAWRSGDCAKRVVRGGSWHNGPWHMRAAFRHRFSTDLRSYHNGLRVARTLAPRPEERP